MKRPPRETPKTDDAPFVPAEDKPPRERTPKEVRDAIEADAAEELGRSRPK